MRFIQIALFISLVSLSSSYSQSPANKNWDGTNPEIYSGAKAFVFFYSPFVSNQLGPAFAGNLTLITDTSITSASLTDINFLGVYGIGFKYFVSPRFDLNLGLNIGSATIEEQRSGQSGTGSSALKLTAFTFGISVDGNYRLKTLYNISPYLGANINFASLNAEVKNTSGTTFNDELTGSTIGFGANFGFDWYFTPGMSLGGKYTLGWMGSGGLEETITSGSTTSKIKYPKMNSWGTGIVSILLNVHF